MTDHNSPVLPHVFALDILRIEAIYISPGHNFIGRWGKTPLNHKIQRMDEATCVENRGIEGDRFFDYKKDHIGQITFFSKEVYTELCDALQIYDKEPSVLRRNVIVSGVDLNALIGETFAIQGIVFEGTVECSPCAWMDQAFGRGAHEFLKGRGGLRCKIKSTGVLRTDAVSQD